MLTVIIHTGIFKIYLPLPRPLTIFIDAWHRLGSLYSLPNLVLRLWFCNNIFQNSGICHHDPKVSCWNGCHDNSTNVYVVKWNINTSTMIAWPILFESTSFGVRRTWIQILTAHKNVHHIVSLCLSLLICNSCSAGHLLCAHQMSLDPSAPCFLPPKVLPYDFHVGSTQGSVHNLTPGRSHIGSDIFNHSSHVWAQKLACGGSVCVCVCSFPFNRAPHQTGM